jgi:GMP synthase-like glutamine amidotransferase
MQMTKHEVWYITIDSAADVGDHTPHMAGIQTALLHLNSNSKVTSGGPLTLHRYWWGDISHLTAADLEAKPIAAIVASGSHDEWIHMGLSNPAWGEWIKRLAQVMKSTTIPMLCICGSHQVLHAAYSEFGWAAVAHMSHPNEESEGYKTITSELETGTSCIPSPRMSEYGIFPLTLRNSNEVDPIYNGVSTLPIVWVTENHSDCVIDSRVSPQFESLLVPAPFDEQLMARAVLSKTIDPEARSLAQMYRWKGSDRILYSCQFHPELTCYPFADDSARLSSACIENAGQSMLQNFFTLAVDFWVHKG